MTGSSPQCLPVDTVIAINKQQARGRVCLFDYGGVWMLRYVPLFRSFLGTDGVARFTRRLRLFYSSLLRGIRFLMGINEQLG